MKNYKTLVLIILTASMLLACQEESEKSNTDPGLEIWATPDLVSVSAASYSLCPDVAVQQNGDAFVVWLEDEGTGRRATVFMNTYSAQSGWGNPTIIDPIIDPYYSECPRIAMNESGDAIVGWLMADENSYRYRMWVKQYTVVNGWEPAKRIDVDYQTSGLSEGFLIESDVAIDELGNAVAVWIDESNTERGIWANTFTIGAGWDLAMRISTQGIATYDPKVAMGAGNAIAAWSENGGITAINYQAGNGWGIPRGFENGEGNSSDPQVSMSADGSGIVIWHQEEYRDPVIYPPKDMYAAHYTGANWSDIKMINPNRDLKNSNSGRIAMDANGNAIAVWRNVFSSDSHISTSYYDKSLNQWGITERISDNAGYSPDVAMTSNGDAVVSWGKYLGVYNGPTEDVNVRRFSKDTGWGPAGRIGRTYVDDTFLFVEVAMNKQGDFFTVWDQYKKSNYSYDVFASTIK